MRFRAVLSVAILFLAFINFAAWSSPASDRLVTVTVTPPADTLSQSGKIASIGDASFSLEITSGQDKKTMKFMIDDDTKMEGRLKVGSQATVEYRAQGGYNVAVYVVVKPPSAAAAR